MARQTRSERRARRAAQAESRALLERAGGMRNGLRGLFSFGGEVRGELAKVDFPDRQQTWQATLVVVAACLIVGAYLYGLDQVFARFATKLVDLQR